MFLLANVVIDMNYYISDLHFGCANKFDNRTLEHDQLIIDNWNRVVTNADTVYILGDIGRIGSNKENEYLCKCISVLKGKKILVLGNHDDNLKDARLRQLFTEVTSYKEIIDNSNGMSVKLILSHYPILFWSQQHKGSILMYGHLHASEEWTVFNKSLDFANEYFKDRTLKGYNDCPQARAYNVSAMLDYMDWTPRTLKEIMLSNDA